MQSNFRGTESIDASLASVGAGGKPLRELDDDERRTKRIKAIPLPRVPIFTGLHGACTTPEEQWAVTPWKKGEKDGQAVLFCPWEGRCSMCVADDPRHPEIKKQHWERHHTDAESRQQFVCPVPKAGGTCGHLVHTVGGFKNHVNTKHGKDKGGWGIASAETKSGGERKKREAKPKGGKAAKKPRTEGEASAVAVRAAARVAAAATAAAAEEGVNADDFADAVEESGSGAARKELAAARKQREKKTAAAEREEARLRAEEDVWETQEAHHQSRRKHQPRRAAAAAATAAVRQINEAEGMESTTDEEEYVEEEHDSGIELSDNEY